MTFRGVDVSVWQPTIDWAKVKNSGISFAMLRGAYGESTDTKFNEHIKGAIEQGINVGVYVYSIANTVEKAIREADHVLELVKPYKITYPIVIDMEAEELSALNIAQRTDIGFAFCRRIEEAGYYAAIYSNKYWLETQIDYERLKRFDIWLAQWAKTATWAGNYGIWQYGLDTVDGIGSCDCDISYRDYPDIISKAGLNNLGTASTPSVPVSTQPSAPQTPPAPVLQVGSRVRYKGAVQYSSWGIGKPIQVDGTFVVQRIIKNRKYGVQIDQLGWIAESDCRIV